MKNTLIINVIPTSLPKDYKIDFKDDSLPTILKIEWAYIKGIYGEESAESFFIKPIGTYIDPELLNGISYNRLIEIGVSIESVLKKLYKILPKIEYIVGFNIDFVIKMLQSIFYRNEYNIVEFKMKRICLMKKGADLCRIPSRFGNSFKYPTYSELYNFIYKTDYKDNMICSKYDLTDMFYKFIDKKLFKEFNILPNPKHTGYYKIVFNRDNINQIKFETKENSLIDIKFNEKIIFSDVSEYCFYKHVGLITVKKKFKGYYESTLFDLNGRIHNTLTNAEIYLETEGSDDNYYWGHNLANLKIHNAYIKFYKFKYAFVQDYDKGSLIIGKELGWLYSVEINNKFKWNLINWETNELYLSIYNNDIIYENEIPNIIFYNMTILNLYQ